MSQPRLILPGPRPPTPGPETVPLPAALYRVAAQLARMPSASALADALRARNERLESQGALTDAHRADVLIFSAIARCQSSVLEGMALTEQHKHSEAERVRAELAAADEARAELAAADEARAQPAEAPELPRQNARIVEVLQQAHELGHQLTAILACGHRVTTVVEGLGDLADMFNELRATVTGEPCQLCYPVGQPPLIIDEAPVLKGALEPVRDELAEARERAKTPPPAEGVSRVD